MFDEAELSVYHRAQQSCVQFNLDSTIIKMTGQDRRKFLHNFCTNEINALESGTACEAFILNEKGKTLAHLHVLSLADSLILHAAGGYGQTIIDHLDRYLIRDDVVMEDVSDSHFASFFSGPAAASAIKERFNALPVTENQVAEDACGAIIANVEIAGFGLLVIQSSEIDFEVPVGSDSVFEAIRIEQRTPRLGRDIDDSNLPQELLRDEKCISFKKGCYLGQETVARIDAIGRVNRVIAAVEIPTAAQAGDELIFAEKNVGKVTSAAWSPAGDRRIGLVIVRRPHEKVGTTLECSSGGSATVI